MFVMDMEVRHRSWRDEWSADRRSASRTFAGQSAYVRSTNGEPWGVTDNDVAMNRVFGNNACRIFVTKPSIPPSCSVRPGISFFWKAVI